MDDIKDIRLRINEIDRKMAELFEQRMFECEKVAQYKKANAIPVEDKIREREVIENNLSFINNQQIKPYYINYMQGVMDISKRYQERLNEGMKIAYSGTEGAFAYIAGKRIFDAKNLVAYKSFKEAYNSVVNGFCDACVLPIENSFAGDVGEVMDLIFSGSLFINKIENIDVVHNLIGLKNADVSGIKTVISHPQALSQCKDYIESHGYKTIEYPNTALSAQKLTQLNDPTIGAIASFEVAELYDLKLLETNINTSRNNTTRFALFSKVLSKVDNKVKMGKHFILVFTVLNQAGALAKTLNIIGSHGFNMRTLRSRPMKELIWNYYFFVELDGDVYSQDGQDMLKELKSVCDRLKLVGNYYSHTEK